MNTIRGMVYLSMRGYRTNRGRESARRVKPPRQIEMIQPGMPVENIFDEDKDPEDLDEYASDFQNVAQFDKMHERELEIQKSKLLTQIVKRKYFKSEEPPMLTWSEKEQIRRLHSQDPEEWTPETLSESFPASREAIAKILRSKWSPKSVKVVENYERNVKKNWDLFKAGKLEIDPQLEAHLSKFKDRNITIMDTKTIAKKILHPKPHFPKPQSDLFSNIITSYLNEKSSSKDEIDEDMPNKNANSATKKIEAPKNKSFKDIIDDNSSINDNSEKSTTIKNNFSLERKLPNKTTFTFEQFIKNHVENIREDKITPVDRVIVDELKKKTTEDYKSKSLVFQSQNPVDAWKKNMETSERLPVTFDNDTSITGSEKLSQSSEMMEKTSDYSGVTKIRGENSSQPEVPNNLEGTIETGIISRYKTEAAAQDDYPEFIKIPRNKYKPGVTYKVEDRYYDDDGELLYRVPGLKT